MNVLRSIFISLVFHASLANGELSENDIAVLALFTDAAMLNIGGNHRLLKSGQRSAEGVLLVEANSREAVIEYAGNRMTLNLSDRISGKFAEPALKVVTIALNNRGQYMTVGSINNVPVSLLVDTGASTIAINSVLAKSLGINVDDGKRVKATTAGGVVSSTQVMLDEVRVGDIKVNNVSALVIDGEYPTDVLLGMSFLRQVEISEASGLMVLKSRL